MSVSVDIDRACYLQKQMSLSPQAWTPPIPARAPHNLCVATPSFPFVKESNQKGADPHSLTVQSHRTVAHQLLLEVTTKLSCCPREW